MRLITVVNPHRVYCLVKLWAQSGTRASGKTSDGSSNTTVKDGEQCGGIVGGRVRHARRLRNGDVRKGKMRPPSAKKKRKHDTVCPKGEGSTNILSALDFLLSGPSQPRGKTEGSSSSSAAPRRNTTLPSATDRLCVPVWGSSAWRVSE